jgi:uncharacterized protein YuzE
MMRGMAIRTWLQGSDEEQVAYLRFTDPEVEGVGGSVKTVEVSLSEEEDDSLDYDILLDFNESGQLIGIEFLNVGNLPPGAAFGS